MNRIHFEVAQTAVTILAEERYHRAAQEAIFETREIIEEYVHQHPMFQTALEPYEPGARAPHLIRRMCSTASRAGLGPMATVAGTIAEAAVVAMMEEGATQAVVDNGGDLALLLSDRIHVGLYTGNPRFKDLGMRLEPREGAFGMCTSSGTVGPSLSFGRADSATVISRDVLLADACATRLGNEITLEDEAGMERALGLVMDIEGVEGALAVAGEHMGMKGELPKLIRMSEVEDRITTRLFPDLE
ncbi:MAG: UPF0280 family protein [Methanomassiliicoccales archaeon]